MSRKTIKKASKQPAEQLISDFLKLHNIAIVLDNTDTTTENIPGVLYTVDRRPRVRFFFKEDIMQKEKKTNSTTPKMEIN